MTEFLLYTAPSGKVKVEIYFLGENIWLTQDKMAKLFGVKQPAIAKHLKNIFESGELLENSVHSILEYTANDGKKYQTKFYNLDAIISVGYRVNSAQATQYFKGVELDAFKSEAGFNYFTMSPSKWINATNAKIANFE